MNTFIRYHRHLYLFLLLLTLPTCTAVDDVVANIAETTSVATNHCFELPLASSRLTQECLGSSLLQATSRRTPLQGLEEEGPAAPGIFSLRDLLPVDRRVRVGLIFLVLCVVVLCGGWLYTGSKVTKEVALHVEGHEDKYEDVEEEESDAGDWQVDDLVAAPRALKNLMTSSMPSLFSRHTTMDSDSSAHDPEGVAKHIESAYGSWKLLQNIMGALFEFWAALAFMYWSLLYREEEMMDCSAYPTDQPHSFFARHACFYSLACLRGFPIFAANMVLVLMVRIIVQTRMYYSMLRLGKVVHFVSAPVMTTLWPWVCMLSMLQGGLHFAVKAYFDPQKVAIEMMYLRLVRKFVLPGTIFFSFLMRYADIENALVPLNRICEQDATKKNRECPWLSKVQVMNERVLAFDARHTDVVGRTQTEVGKAPNINDLVQNLIENYETAYDYWERRKHRDWGLFRSMWPASVLLDRRLDRSDPDTRAWWAVFVILSSGCMIVSMCSLYLLFFRMLFVGGWNSETMLGNLVLVFHGILIIIFISRTVNNMFYFAMKSEQRSRSRLTRRLSMDIVSGVSSHFST